MAASPTRRRSPPSSGAGVGAGTLAAAGSGDADVPGAAHLGERGNRRPRAFRRKRPGTRSPSAGGSLIIAFHSLEDRIVKQTFRRLAEDASAARLLTRRPLVAGDEESRAQSAGAQRDGSGRLRGWHEHRPRIRNQVRHPEQPRHSRDRRSRAARVSPDCSACQPGRRIRALLRLAAFRDAPLRLQHRAAAPEPSARGNRQPATPPRTSRRCARHRSWKSAPGASSASSRRLPPTPSSSNARISPLRRPVVVARAR